jgi:hypothetical protein
MTDPNLERLCRIAGRLGSLRERVVFLGGASVGLLVTDPAAPPLRTTKDVDAIIEVGTTVEYSVQLRDELLALGLREDVSPDAPLCRWIADDIILDLMPTNSGVLGFTNRWYREAMDTAVERVLPTGVSVRIVTAPCFLATKLDAFDGRGGGDYALSHDLEDLIAVVDGRPELVAEVGAAAPSLRSFIGTRIANLLADARFVDALPGHLPGDPASQRRVPLLLERLTRLSSLG